MDRMSTKRTPRGRPPSKPPITPAAIAAFRRAEEIYNAEQEEAWEEDGGRRREYLDAHCELQLELRLRPWETSPLDLDEDLQRPDYENAADWNKALTLRRALLAAMES
jgi:hypothetical protein